ncbi:DUF742 domain-containing protein [Streptomyces sp. GC420]|uniref:DUF742 domain-containing protein n=1 Tax=Streptomyces sp. GC420 TaxID=2697568 RepID=UPI0037D9B337
MAPSPPDGPWFDDEAGRLIRPYAVSNGRTRPSAALDLLTLVRADGPAPPGHLGPEHAQALALCDGPPVPVAEIAAQLRLPVAVTKILLSDLLDYGAVTAQAPAFQDNPTAHRSDLEATLDGLRRRL